MFYAINNEGYYQLPLQDESLIDAKFVTVEGENYRRVVAAAELLWSNSKTTPYGKGVGTTNDDPYRVARTGKLGEMALAIAYNLEADMGYVFGGDEYDFKINNKTFNIKCARQYKTYGIVIRQDRRGRIYEINNDFYLFSFLEHEDRERETADVVLVGYTSGIDVGRCNTFPGVRDVCVNYHVPYLSLNSMKHFSQTFFQ